MKVTCLQMNIKLGVPQDNICHASELIRTAMVTNPDVLVLPETWNTGFFPKENLPDLCDRDGEMVIERIGALARQYHVNIIAGSISNMRNGQVFNTALMLNREGECIASYDKTHLFSPMGEDVHYTHGDHLCLFSMDGIQCASIICYDIRFPELARILALKGANILFVVSQWPRERIFHLHSLAAARAIENQMFVVCCNSCGTAEGTVYGGNSVVIDPSGKPLAIAGETEEAISANIDMQRLSHIRDQIPVFRDRRPDLYSAQIRTHRTQV
ncbi:MAG: carbon-nitrogen family hydrolase [Clostridia bacterium]|nr:carbon-nitrogen family hydrolase [Clostridia bacterium]MBQ4265899.1 carbon-nitrogen family hydrolase [Clostridia bacterium]